jgi:membrane associated rhomboid family serine protease
VWRGRSGLRIPVVALGYAGVLLATNVWLETGPASTERRVLASVSTDVAHLGRDPWVVLPASALFTRGGLVFALAGCLVCVGLLEMAVGPRLTVLVAVAGHVIGTLVSEGVVAVRIAVNDLPDSARHALDVGPSYILVACALTVVGWHGVDTRLRIAAAVVLAPLFVFTAVRLPAGRVDAIGHLTAATVGLAFALWLRRRPRPIPRPAT